MTICYFGIYDSQYSRNRIFIKGLRQNGAEVLECVSTEKGISKYFDLIKKHRRIRNSYDCLVVGFPGQQAAILARFLTSKPIIFDALVSLYDSLVYDRKTVRENSFKALYFWFLDWLSCHLATKIICDTSAHIDYFSKTFHISKNKFKRIFIGSDDEVIKPVLTKDLQNHKNFKAHFHGFFNPLQGLPYIIHSAKLLEGKGVVFNIIGSGQDYDYVRKLALDLKCSNVNFILPVPYDKLKEYMSQADICLGIFGNTEKALRVIPNKVFEALAGAMPIVTSLTPGAKELLIDRENVLFCKISDSKDLADKILELKNNSALKTKIAENGHKLFKEKLLPNILGRELLNLIQEIVQK